MPCSSMQFTVLWLAGSQQHPAEPAPFVAASSKALKQRILELGAAELSRLGSWMGRRGLRGTWMRGQRACWRPWAAAQI